MWGVAEDALSLLAGGLLVVMDCRVRLSPPTPHEGLTVLSAWCPVWFGMQSLGLVLPGVSRIVEPLRRGANGMQSLPARRPVDTWGW